MISDLLNGWSVFGIVREQGKYKVFELWAEILATHFCEVSFVLVSKKQVVEILFRTRFLEGEDALHYDKEDNSKRE